MPQQKYIFQVGLQKYETACLLFQSSLDALFNDFGHDVDDMVSFIFLCFNNHNNTHHCNKIRKKDVRQGMIFLNYNNIHLL